MTSIAVFAGPSLPPDRRPTDPSICWYEPASAGDLLAIADSGFDRVCLIDGYFDDRPAPWHKEIMLLMARGIEVFGASSMGALRAAELNGQGMIGVGRIYRAFRSRLLTGDDEVALIHAPRALGWAPLSIPLVEIRASLCPMVRRHLLDVTVARSMLKVASELFYADRDWPELRRQWLANGVAPADIEMVAEGHVPLKLLDALDCVEASVARVPHHKVNVPVPETSFLAALRAEVALRLPAHPVI